MRVLCLLLGLFFAGTGLAGIPIPGLPSTPFFILSAFFFARSSPKLLAWVEGLPRIGSIVVDYRAGRGLPLKIKRSALFSMVVLISISCLIGGLSLWMMAVVLCIGAVGGLFVWYFVPTQRADKASFGQKANHESGGA